TVTNEYLTAGDFTVRCRFRTGLGEEYVATCPGVIRTCYSSVQYVSPAGAHIWPYNTWERAATNIQHALDVAANSTVMLDDGLFPIQDPLMITNPLTLTSRNGAEHTTVRMVASNRCIYLNYPGAIVEKLTVQNGLHAEAGGGVWCGSNTVLRSCIVEGSRSGSRGGGIFGASFSVIENCEIKSNLVSSGYNVFGGGYYGEQNALLTNCVLLGNVAEAGTHIAYGGGPGRGKAHGGAYAGSNAVLWGCQIIGNRCSGQGGSCGGGIYMDGGSAEVVTLAGNDAKGASVPVYPPKYVSSYFCPGHGGGGYLLGNAILRHTIINENVSVYGGGLYLNDAQVGFAHAYSNQCITIREWNNSHPGSGGGVCIGGNAQINNSLVYLNASQRGGGILTQAGDATIFNTTIVNNKAETGAGIFNESGQGDVLNSIVYYNRNYLETNVEIDDAEGRLLLRNCCYRSASVEGIDCTTNAPLFVDWLPLYEGDNQFRPQTW
ncbi:MAG: hypothetical protein PHG65_08040, partial [Kiritimatiellae bacterium]|nr:hypothetical protein [Kiritimatiellia bacterium]